MANLSRMSSKSICVAKLLIINFVNIKIPDCSIKVSISVVEYHIAGYLYQNMKVKQFPTIQL